MIKRTIEISREAVHLAVRNRQLLIQPKDDKTSATSIPCEDIGIVVIDHPATTLTHAAMKQLSQAGAVVVFCGNDHLPCGMMLPVSTHSEIVHRIHDQINAAKPSKKRIWKQIVIAKIKAQANNLHPQSPVRKRLMVMTKEVKSGDPNNIEAQAAKLYWKVWLSDHISENHDPFRRDIDGKPPNNLLNYGYAVIRAAVARTLVSSGMQPALGVHHSNRSNPFCLADDLMEPLRPLVDAKVRDLYLQRQVQLHQEVKAELLSLLTQTVNMGDEKGPLMVALHRMSASLADCFARKRKSILIPVVIDGL